MSFEKGLIWLASYPKSGNTWFRVALANALNNTNTPIDINSINKGMSASSRDLINRALGFNSLLLSQHELDRLLPSIYAWYAKQGNAVRYFKTHNAYTSMNAPEGCLGAIYFIRNPLDVAISFAHHCHFSIDKAIQIMGDKKYITTPSRYGAGLYMQECYLSWACHVNSWVSAKNINVLLLRYEDMHFKTFDAFKKAFDFLKINRSHDALLQIIDNSRIHKLQQQEAQFGFVEKSQRQRSPFFRKGIVGDWENTLSKSQIKRIIRDHAETMVTHGYLDENFRPICYY